MTRYELLDRIGVGGMAEIFRGRAVAEGGFEKPVAIKRILPKFSQDERFVSMLITEAKTLSQLRHRNIVQIFDVGLGNDGQYFLVMEFVEGMDLGALFAALQARGKRLPAHLSLHMAAEICDALHFAHNARGSDDQPLNLVHRDVSPSNVLLSRMGEVKLTDFGIAKRTEETTGHGGVRGKFAYISPEQAFNSTVDGRSDVYSLGIVLFELVTGHRLWSGMTDIQALEAVRAGKTTRPRELDESISAGLDEIVMTALAADPADRYPDAGAFGAALRNYRYSTLTSAGDPGAEIGRILLAIRSRPAGSMAAEPTVVRIATAAGFAMAGQTTPVLLGAESLPGGSLDRAAVFQAASPVFSGIGVETTDEPTLELHLEQLLEVAPITEHGLPDAETGNYQPVPDSNDHNSTARGDSFVPVSLGAAAVVSPSSALDTERSARPLPGLHERESDPFDVDPVVVAASDSRASGREDSLITETVELSSDSEGAGRRRVIAIGIIAAAVLGLAAFVIAGGLLADDSSSMAAGDQELAAVDAGVDADVTPDAGADAKLKPEPDKPRRKVRKKRGGKKASKRANKRTDKKSSKKSPKKSSKKSSRKSPK